MNIFECSTYKTAIKYLLRSNNTEKRGQFRKLAEHLGVHATLISQILSGSKDFSEEQLFSACEFLGCGNLEKKYLWSLLQIERSGSVAIKKHYIDLCENYKKKSTKISQRIELKKELNQSEAALFYSSWLYSAVHLSTTLDHKIDLSWICKKFSLEPRKAREILDFLISINIVKENNGHFTTGTTSTHLSKESPFLPKHHTNWRIKSIQQSEYLESDELMYTATFSVSKKDFLKIREDIMNLIKKFLADVKDSPAEDLAQFNIDYFWLK